MATHKEVTIGRKYLVELGASIAIYVLLLLATNALLRHGVATAWRVPVALMPMAGGLLAVWAIMRQLGRIDEMQRRIQFDVIALALLGTALLTFSYGFLEGIGFPRLSMFVVWPLMAIFWGAGSFVAMWRHR